MSTESPATTDKAQIRSEITYSPLRRDELPLLSRLIGGMHTEDESSLRVRTYSADYYDWMYFRNPAGDAVVFAGRHRGQIVTSFAITPKRLQIGGKVVVCGKTMDMFTHPEYQGLGLIKEVTSRVFSAARERGIDMWYVTPSVNSYPIFLNKWNYVESVRVNYVVRVLRYGPLLSTMVKPGAAGSLVGGAFDLARKCVPRPAKRHGFTVAEEREFGRDADALWERCRDFPVALVRDAAYLRWRYLDNPDRYEIEKFSRDGQLRGILVTKHTRRRGLQVGEFVDCVAAPDDAEVRTAMYRHALERFEKSGCAFAQAWAIQDSRWEQEMFAAGVNRRRKKMALLFSPNPAEPDFHDPKAWYLTQGDGNDL